MFNVFGACQRGNGAEGGEDAKTANEGGFIAVVTRLPWRKEQTW